MGTDEEEDEDETGVYVETAQEPAPPRHSPPSPVPSTSTSTQPKKKSVNSKTLKRKRDECELEMLQSLSHSLAHSTPREPEAEDDEAGSFCIYIYRSLKALDQRTQNIVQHEIQGILFKAQMGLIGGQYHQMPTQPQSQNYSDAAYSYMHMLNN